MGVPIRGVEMALARPPQEDDAPGAGAFGPGWSSTADERLVVDDEGATWVRATGRHVVFPRAGAGWGRAVGENLWLEALDAADSSDSTAAGARGAGGFVVSDNEGGRWCFDVAGRPAWWSRGGGHARGALLRLLRPPGGAGP